MAEECGEPHLGNGYRALYGDEDGAVRVSRIGDGVVQWWEGSTPLTNDAIDDAGNLEFVLNAIGGRERRILWDEYYHGQRRSLLSYAASTPLAWAGLQLLILALAAAMTFTRRRAPIRPRWTPGRHAPMEFVETMATLYEEAGALSAALQTSGARTRRLIREATGLPAGTPDDRLAAALALRRSQDPAEIESLLTASGASVTRRDWSEASVLAIVRRLQQLSLTLSGAGGGVRRAQEDVRTVA